jgi:hypothetical protein
MDLSKLLDWVKLPTKTIAALCIIFGILIFSNDFMLDKLGLRDLVFKYKPYLGGGFLIILVLLIVDLFSRIGALIRLRINKLLSYRKMKKRLQNLTLKEKLILGSFITCQTRDQSLSIQDGTVNGLTAEKIIVRASSCGDFYIFDFLIHPWAWEYLNKHPELVDNHNDILNKYLSSNHLSLPQKSQNSPQSNESSSVRVAVHLKTGNAHKPKIALWKILSRGKN